MIKTFDTKDVKLTINGQEYGGAFKSLTWEPGEPDPKAKPIRNYQGTYEGALDISRSDLSRLYHFLSVASLGSYWYRRAQATQRRRKRKIRRFVDSVMRLPPSRRLEAILSRPDLVRIKVKRPTYEQCIGRGVEMIPVGYGKLLTE